MGDMTRKMIVVLSEEAGAVCWDSGAEMGLIKCQRLSWLDLHLRPQLHLIGPVDDASLGGRMLFAHLIGFGSS